MFNSLALILYFYFLPRINFISYMIFLNKKLHKILLLSSFYNLLFLWLKNFTLFTATFFWFIGISDLANLPALYLLNLLKPLVYVGVSILLFLWSLVILNTDSTVSMYDYFCHFLLIYFFKVLVIFCEPYLLLLIGLQVFLSFIFYWVRVFLNKRSLFSTYFYFYLFILYLLNFYYLYYSADVAHFLFLREVLWLGININSCFLDVYQTFENILPLLAPSRVYQYLSLFLCNLLHLTILIVSFTSINTKK